MADAATLKLTKSTNWGDVIYYVELDGIKVGWVLREDRWSTNAGKWTAYLHTRDGLKAEKVAYGYGTRRDVLMEAVSHLEIRRSGLVVRFDPETIKDIEERIEPTRLRALWQKLLDEKYPELKESK